MKKTSSHRTSSHRTGKVEGRGTEDERSSSQHSRERRGIDGSVGNSRSGILPHGKPVKYMITLHCFVVKDLGSLEIVFCLCS